MQEREWWLEERGGEASGILGTSPPGLAWVLAPKSGQSEELNGRTRTVCARPLRPLLHQQRRKAPAFLPVPLGLHVS